MKDQPSRRAVLATTLTVAAAAALPAMGKELTIKDLNKGLAKPLTPANEKLAAAALVEVNKTSVGRLKHKLPENSEPSMVFQIRPGATKTW